jgi:hypothetical protein
MDTLKTTSAAELKKLVTEITETIAYHKSIVEQINAELLSRYEKGFKEEFERAGKTEGELTRKFDGISITMAIKPKIKWDNKKLENVAANLPWETVSNLFKIEFSITETKYKSISDPKLKDAIMDARTVEHTAPKITFTKE